MPFRGTFYFALLLCFFSRFSLADSKERLTQFQKLGAKLAKDHQSSGDSLIGLDYLRGKFFPTNEDSTPVWKVDFTSIEAPKPRVIVSSPLQNQSNSLVPQWLIRQQFDPRSSTCIPLTSPRLSNSNEPQCPNSQVISDKSTLAGVEKSDSLSPDQEQTAVIGVLNLSEENQQKLLTDPLFAPERISSNIKPLLVKFKKLSKVEEKFILSVDLAGTSVDIALQEASSSLCGFPQEDNPTCLESQPAKLCGCYDHPEAIKAGLAKLKDGTDIELVDGAPGSGFKVWKEKNGNRILGPTGLWSSDSDWQQTLGRPGTSFSGASFIDLSQIAGRVCPPHVFVDHGVMTATDRCLYYDAGNPAQGLNRDSSGVEASDWLKAGNSVNTGRGARFSYFEGNIKTCADKGMRLPTLYETTVSKPSNSLPTGDGINPSFAGSQGVPASGARANYRDWTATGWDLPSNGNMTIYWYWIDSRSHATHYYGSLTVRCVLPNRDGSLTGPPTIDEVMAAGNTQIFLTWTAPTHVEGSGIIDYIIEYSSDNGLSWTVFNDGISTNKSSLVTGLRNDRTYIFRMASVNDGGKGNYSSPTAPISPALLPCGNDCYLEGASPKRPKAAQDLPIGFEREGPEKAVISLQYANGHDGFKIWKERPGNRILNSAGRAADGWQKQLSRAGTSFTSDFTATNLIEGRVCPPHVFLDHNNMTATDRCLYYDLGNPAQGLDRDSSGVEASDWLKAGNSVNTGRGARFSYFEGNIKTCADKGMRLPTLYETTASKPPNSLPTGDGINPSFAGSKGVPTFGDWGSWPWTATGWDLPSNGNMTIYYVWIENDFYATHYYDSRWPVRCVLPSNPPSICLANASGGTITEVGSGLTPRFRIHTFSNVGTETFTVLNNCPMEVLVVAGGGGAGSGRAAGGGGAGGVLYFDNFIFPSNGAYTVTVGAGGSARTQGQNSSVSNLLVAVGGGRGGNGEGWSEQVGGSGGSGGGGGFKGGWGAGAGTPGQGHNGGNNRNGNWISGGGGGGAGGGGHGGHGNNRGSGGPGGPGRAFTIRGATEYFGGGGGGRGQHDASSGGAGGGGSGGREASGTAGAPGTGGGGGGSDGPGGSGIVIIKYQIK